MSEATGHDRAVATSPPQVDVWIEEEANVGGFRAMLVGFLLLVGLLLVLPFLSGLSSGLQFLYQGFFFQAGPGWWSISAAYYILLFGIVVGGAVIFSYRFRGQVVKVGIGDSGVLFCSRRVQRFVLWSRILPGPSTMERGRGYVIEVLKPDSTWRTSLFVLGPRAGAAVIHNPHFPAPR